MKVLLVGSKISALACGPATSTRPSFSRVAVWFPRAELMLAVFVQSPALASAAQPYADTTTTATFKNRVTRTRTFMTTSTDIRADVLFVLPLRSAQRFLLRNLVRVVTYSGP